MSSSADQLRHRNGRLVACTPCRRRKVSCDHRRPTCDRCRKRRQGEGCVYPDSTRISSDAQSQRITGGLSTNAEAVSVSPDAVFRGSNAQERSPQLLGLSHHNSLGNTASNAASNNASSSSNSRAGYFGPTSHDSIFEETKFSLSLLRGLPLPASSPTDTEHKVRRYVYFHDLPKPLRETCLEVLRCLPGQSNAQIEFSPGASEPKGWAYLAVDRIIRSLQETYGDVLSRGESGLEAMVEILCNNTTRTIEDSHNLQQWLDQFCGQNLRWESIGLLWAHLEHVSDLVDSLHPRRLYWISARESPEQGYTFLKYCIDAARAFSASNDLLLDLARRLATLASVVDGDAALSNWGAHGFTVALLTYLGLHVLENSPTYRPSFCSEYKRRLVAQSFLGEKIGCGFTGRPPLMCGNYFSTPLPLDIKDADLAGDEATLEQAIASLDERGWNTKDAIYSATVLRARYLISTIQDELLQLSLSKTAVVTPEKLRDIKARQVAMMREFPRCLQYDPDDYTTWHTEIEAIYIRLSIRLEYLQNLFFIERLLLRTGQVDEGDLLVTSFALVSLTLKIWTYKDRFSRYAMRRNFEWLVMAYGAPGGGMLCLELLRPSFSGTHPKDPELSRSRIVQNLSLLVGFLDWVVPSAPNGDLCADAKAIIQHVLDHHLNMPLAHGQPTTSVDWGFLSQPDFNFELLDTFDWLRQDPGHP